MIADLVDRPNVLLGLWIVFALAMASPPAPEQTAPPPPDVEALNRQALEGIATMTVLQIELRASHARVDPPDAHLGPLRMEQMWHATCPGVVPRPHFSVP